MNMGEMIFSNIRWKITLLLFICFCSLETKAKYGGGSGEPNDPYLIYTAEHMQAIGADSNDWGSYFKMVADINLAHYDGQEGRPRFNMIGRWQTMTPFVGVFDGNSHTIQNFTWHANDVDGVGIFGYVRNQEGSGKIENVTVLNPIINTAPRNITGTLVGNLWSGLVHNCTISGAVVSGGNEVGGLVGNCSSGEIYQCSSSGGTVSGTASVGGLIGAGSGTHVRYSMAQGIVSGGTEHTGGLIGRAYTVDVNSCYCNVDVVGTYKIGGLIGSCEGNSGVYNCYVTGSISGGTSCGGLLGYVKNTSSSYKITVINCYSTGLVTGDVTNVQPLIGYRSGWMQIEFCYWDSQTSGFTTGTYGWPKTTAQMHSIETFYLWGLSSPGLWRIDNGNDYPRLIWENTVGTIITEPMFAGGTGEPDDPYLISTPQQLNLIGASPEIWDKNFKQIDNLNLSGYSKGEFKYITNFTGVFDGNGHIISNYHGDRSLFHHVNDPNARIRNLGLIDPNIQGSDGGGIVGSLVAGQVMDCFVQGGRCSGGGLVAQNYGRIERCFTDCTVDGRGGLVSYNENTGEIHHCYSLGNVISQAGVGGLVGSNRGLIKHSYSRGDAISTEGVGAGGGLAGGNSGTIICCYSTGSATGRTVGGLVGNNGGSVKPVNVISSFWDKQSSSLSESASGLGRTTAEMKTAANYIGWGDGKTWTIVEGSDYPRLWWENAAGVLMINGDLYGGGSGQTEDPYQVADVNHLVALGHCYFDWDKHFILTNDLNLLGIPLDTSIGAELIPFTGIFDGNGYTISNYTAGNDSWGLFALVDGNEVEIRDVGLINPTVVLEFYKVGSLVCELKRGRVVNCYANNVNIGGRAQIGGLVGKVGVECQVINCYSTGFIGATSIYTVWYGDMGGLIGLNEGDVSNCWSSAYMSGGLYKNVGGLIGLNSSTGRVWESYATGDVHSNDDNIGGFVGGNNGQIIECWASGEVVGDLSNENVGGLVGENRGTVSGCYSMNTRVLHSTNTGGLVGANHGDIQDSYSTKPVYGYENVGGLAGENNGLIVNCYAIGNVYGIWEFKAGSSLGGLVGYNFEKGTINSCKASGWIYGYDYVANRWRANNVGGLVGWNKAAEVSNSYATGRVEGGNIVGGLVGRNELGLVVYCYSTGLVVGDSKTGGMIGSSIGRVISAYWDTSTSGQGFSAGGNGKTTLQLKSPDTFVGWGCYDAWVLNVGIDYPRLAWEGLPGNYLINDFVYDGGNGTADDPYLISTAQQLANIGYCICEWDKHYKLTGDINMSATGNYSPIGAVMETYSSAPWNPTYSFPFTGTFDGNDHEISSLTIDANSSTGVGLFGCVNDTNSTIKNFTIIYPHVSAYKYGGSLIGYLSEGTVTNCSAMTTEISGNQYVGGLIGHNIHGQISSCLTSGNVIGDSTVGGLIGFNNRGTIYQCSSNGFVRANTIAGGLIGEQFTSISSDPEGGIIECYSSADIQVDTSRGGGLVGYNMGDIFNSYAIGDVNGDGYIGGLIGHDYYWNHISKNCYSTGSVSGNEYVGGLVGYNQLHADLEYCYWDIDTSGQTASEGGEGKSSTEMKWIETFAYWGFDEGVWTIDDNNDYPRLAWQELPGQPITLPKYGGGTGDVNEPYLICTARQLNIIGLFKPHWDKQFRLTNDIDLANLGDRTFNPIGGTSRYDAFEGTFEGEGYAIYNFSFNSQNQDYVGLFRWIGPGAKIRNLTIVDPNVQAGLGNNVGALVGEVYNSYNGSIENCHVYGGSVTGGNMVGGLVGRIDYPIIFTNCSANTTVVSGNMGVGGLAGWLYTGSLNNSFSNANVIGVERVGGLIGGDTSGNVYNCYAKRTVSGTREVGGLIGYNLSDNEIMNCFAATIIEANEVVGGLVGEDFLSYRAKFSGCFWDVNLAPDVNGIGNLYDPNVTPATTVQMKKRNTYINAGWDFIEEKVKGSNDVWEICDGTNYPKLYWQIPIQGDYICPDGVDFFDFSLLAGFWQKQAIEQDYNYDGLVDFYDWAYFADFWNGDYYQLSLFLDQWLTQTAAFVDIAPQSGDNIIDWQDLVKLNENWLEGVE